MTETHIENLSALLELGEKSLNEGDYVKLANFLKGLRDSQPPNPIPHRTTIQHIETAVEFETLKGASMRVCVHRVQTEVFHNGPSRKIVWGSINGNELEMPFDRFRDKLVMIYDIYGMKNIKKSVPYCEPIVYNNVGYFKRITAEQQKNERSNPDDAEADIDPDDWCPSWMVGSIFSLNTYL
jgi:hypothetical protein